MKSYANILKALRKHKRFLISTHVNPDPDALASQLAVKKFLEKMGKETVLVNAAAVPDRFKFLPGAKSIKAYKEGMHPGHDATVIVDCGELDRIGKVRHLIGHGVPVINIDHHITNDGFGDENLVLPEVSSTAEVLYGLFKHARVKLDKQTAILIYFGIMTDTGSFRYDNTSPETHRVSAELMKFDLPVNEFYRRIYETIPADDVKYFTRIISGFKSKYDQRVLYLTLKKSVLKKFSEDFDLRDKIFRDLRAIKGVEVLVILTEEGPHRTRVNFRSQSRFDVARLAARFGGGGHARASGCHVDAGLKAAEEMVLAEIGKNLK